MTTSHTRIISSFIIKLFNGRWEERGRFSAPLSIVAPFANRILNEQVLGKGKSITEPWYKFVPHCTHEDPRQRSPYPEGPTSLTGRRYAPDQEPPPRVALHPEAHIISFTVTLLDFQNEIIQGDYGVDDIFLARAEYLARTWIEKRNMAPDEGPFFYEVEVSAVERRTAPLDLFPPEAYEVEGVFRLPPLEKNRERTKFRKVAPPPLPQRDLSTFGPKRRHGRGKEGQGRVMMHEAVYRALSEDLYLNPRKEDGGYLVGHPFRQPGSPEKEDDPEFRWHLEISDAIQVEGAWGQAGLLLFTGDSWSMVNQRLDKEYPDKKLIGWFHTHLFKATDEFGLSGLDQDLHRRFLTRPWQVAVLINIAIDGSREVRCFQRGLDGNLEECLFEVLEAEKSEE